MAVEENHDPNRINLHYNRINDSDILDHDQILKNIIKVANIFLTKIVAEMPKYNIKSNEIALGRIDFMVTREKIPIILEVNNVSIDLRGRESLKDFNYCKYLTENILIKLLYSKIFNDYKRD